MIQSKGIVISLFSNVAESEVNVCVSEVIYFSCKVVFSCKLAIALEIAFSCEVVVAKRYCSAHTLFLRMVTAAVSFNSNN